MSNAVLSRLIAGALAAWFALVVLLGANGAFVRPPGTAPLPIFIGFAVPIVVFFAVYGFSGAFRAFVLGLDLRFATAIQAWRFAGLGFIAGKAWGSVALYPHWPEEVLAPFLVWLVASGLSWRSFRGRRSWTTGANRSP